MTGDTEQCLDQAVALIKQADGLLIAAGAGMGVDSGLPDFRGDQGFWNHYPALGQRGLSFYQVASPETFHTDPRLAWGFYGHRLNLYRHTAPHAGFGLLLQMAASLTHGAAVFTSNVDGQFQRAGFAPERIVECHGSIHQLQCLSDCPAIWPADDFVPIVDEAKCLLLNDLPRCPQCGGLARPNILMFGDANWREQHADAQYAALSHWLAQCRNAIIIEIGAGTAVPSVRHFVARTRRPFIRINLREFGVGPGNVGLAMGGLAGITALTERVL